MSKKEFPKWFGKNCKYIACIWEENEITGGPDYKEYEPMLVHCSHKNNFSEFEGNCIKRLCPLTSQSEVNKC